MEHGVELGVAVVVCFGLGAGAAVRWVSRRTGVPYTIAMLTLGLASGVLLKRWVQHLDDAPLELFGGDLPGLSPGLILFVFLPALVFESAFALDVHAFRRNLSAVLLLAVPAMVVSIVLVALWAAGVLGGPWGWTLAIGLVFGSLISATDPVAVVAVLRELGAPKHLSLLIEGESLLNDGTAIVAFTVLLGLLLPGAPAVDLLGTALRFLVVVAGGAGVGLALAWVATGWLSYTFNDPLVEIAVTVVLAYAAMIVAEGLLHVSGVMAIVVAGLWMAGPGQTRISPEVRHFLHRFWEVLAFLANTLIFLLVGLAIAFSLDGAEPGELLLVLAIYAGVTVSRFAVIFGFFPILRKLGEPVSAREALVMSWGGLRGAVSLALALIISQEEGLDPLLRHQVLRLTAGVVLLTIVINGTTVGWLLRKLGFVTPTSSELLIHRSALHQALEQVDRRLANLASDPDLASLPWRKVRGEIRVRREALRESMAQLREEVKAERGEGRLVEVWRQALRVEREAYWASFSEGVLGGVALRGLLRELDQQLDALRAGRVHPPATRSSKLHLRTRLGRWLRTLGAPFGAAERGRLALRYDATRAEVEGADAVLGMLSELQPDDEVNAVVRVYRAWRGAAQRRVADLRANLPELMTAVEERLARRIALNLERDRVKSLVARGVLPGAAGDAARDDVETRMKRLARSAAEAELPETAEVCRGTPLFRGLDEETHKRLAELTVEQEVAPGEVLFREGDTGDAVYVVVRGAFRVTRGEGERLQELNVLTVGAVVGEMSVLSATPRNATVTALSTAVVGRIARAKLAGLLDKNEEVRARIWAEFAHHALEDAALAHPALRTLERHRRHAWLAQFAPRELADAEAFSADWGFVVQGALRLGEGRVEAPRLFELGDRACVADGRAVVVPLSAPPAQ